jgi:AraC family transcriptional regulator
VILKEFPDIRWLKAQANAGFANRLGVGGITLPQEGWPSVILNTTTRTAVRDNIMGPLSIFTNVAGLSTLTVDKRRIDVTPELFFISNSGQSYTLEINGQQPTETLNIHFGERFTENALRSLFATQTQLLENEGAPSSFGFHNRIIPKGEQFNTIVDSIRLNGKDPLFLDEKLFELLSLLLREQGQVRAMAEHLEGLKLSTREEIIKRLLFATDYLYTYYDQNPGLDELAQVSCLSKFHFLRLFKIAFGKTPHKFITELKIRKAKEMLTRTKDDIQQIAHRLGFDTASTFSRLFFNQVGVYPSQFRTLIRGI